MTKKLNKMTKKPLIPLAKDTIDKNDINKLIEWLQTFPRLTKGPITTELEQKWAKKFGTKYAVYVNSGSSANLLMLYALLVTGKLKNKKILCPGISWATDLAPIIQLGLEPILVDCNMRDLSVDIEHLKILIEEHQPSALMLVSVLGFSPEMDKIVELCKLKGVELLEDCCESVGTSFNNVMLGNFGIMSSFSLYYGHHLSCSPYTQIPYLDENDIFNIDTIEIIEQKYSNGNDVKKIKIISFNPETFDISYTNPYNIVRH